MSRAIRGEGKLLVFHRRDHLTTRRFISCSPLHIHHIEQLWRLLIVPDAIDCIHYF